MISASRFTYQTLFVSNVGQLRGQHNIRYDTITRLLPMLLPGKMTAATWLPL